MTSETNDWEELGRREPYHAALTNEHFLQDNLSPEILVDFYASGEHDVERFLRLVSDHRGGESRPTIAVDFGCGVGRLAIPLAGRAEHVIAIDAAPSMLALADNAARERGVDNIDFLPADRLSSLKRGSVDFICSYIVFQHLPVPEGERCLAMLLDAAAPNCDVVVHFTLARSGGPVRSFLRWIRRRVPLLHDLARTFGRERKLHHMQMNVYNERRILNIFEERGFDEPAIVRTEHGRIAGAIFVASRSSSP